MKKSLEEITYPTDYDQSSAVIVYEEFHSRLLFRTEFRRFIFIFQLRDVAHGLMTYRHFLLSEF